MCGVVLSMERKTVIRDLSKREREINEKSKLTRNSNLSLPDAQIIAYHSVFSSISCLLPRTGLLLRMPPAPATQ